MTVEQSFELRLRLGELSEETEDLLVRQLDAVVSRFAGVPYATVLQDAPSGREAAHRIVARVRDLGGNVQSVDFDYVTRTEIADRLGATRQAVAYWVAGLRQADFPFPHPAIQAGVELWCWSDVVDWALASNHAVDEAVTLLSADEIAVINGELAAGRMPIFA
ncbi:hypothetical protein ACFRJ9_00785 [Paenarthrobacter sp. NPDC056912]|uniref:hypothetical protein n=1 Tax=Paenarthrobacter sp. NPDC056912 TaxID=3345965 RepID=UPI00367182D7